MDKEGFHSKEAGAGIAVVHNVERTNAIYDILTSKGQYIFTALMRATIMNDVRTVKTLLNSEATMALPNGVTALMLAAHLGHADCVSLLVGKEAGLQQKMETRPSWKRCRMATWRLLGS